MKTLILPLKREWFEQVKSGQKTVEYRLYNSHWKRRLIGKSYDRVVLTLGYPKATDHDRRIERPYRGFDVVKIKHPEWGNQERTCFAIPL